MEPTRSLAQAKRGDLVTDKPTPTYPVHCPNPKDHDWTHAICGPCWDRQHPDTPAPAEPTELDWAFAAACCFCRGTTQLGIFVRAKTPSDLLAEIDCLRTALQHQTMRADTEADEVDGLNDQITSAVCRAVIAEADADQLADRIRAVLNSNIDDCVMYARIHGMEYTGPAFETALVAHETAVAARGDQ